LVGYGNVWTQQPEFVGKNLAEEGFLENNASR
jgi:hypothetical protein